MSRPTGIACARCVRLVQACEGHLENTWDHLALKHYGATDLDEQQTAALMVVLRDYALNRMLALDRDNGNKAEGSPASRIYKSRNTRTSDALAGKCEARRGALRCMRNAGHDGQDRDMNGSHKF